MKPRHFAIIPAAGQSRRMGEPKLLLPWGDQAVIEAVIEAWQRGGVDQVVVVCRPEDSQLRELCQASGAKVVTPAQPPPQMKDSVSAALREIQQAFQPAAHDTWLLAPADMPGLSPAVISRLIEAHESDRPSILLPVHAGRKGHPILLPWSMAPEVHSLGDDQGVNTLLTQYPVRQIACGPDALARDMDTPDDYRRLKQQ